MGKAFYWYRPLPLFGEFYPGKVLDLIDDPVMTVRYFNDYHLVGKYFPDGLTPHGLSMLIEQKLSEVSAAEPITDLVFELVRQLHYPDRPSRLTSLYASESIESANKWLSIWRSNFPDQPQNIGQSLWEIAFDAQPALCDASFLNIPPDGKFSYIMCLDYAHRYWSGKMSSDPLPELLVSCPATVIRRVRGFVDTI